MSFDDFMSALNSMEADGYDVTRGMTRTIDEGDDLGTAYKDTDDGRWSFDEDKQALFDDFEFGMTDEDLDPNLAGSEDVDDALGLEDEDSEVEEEGTDVVGDAYDIEDWNTTFTLPDGTEVNGQTLYEMKNFQEQREEFQKETTAYRAREEEVVRNANIGYDALSQMEAELRSMPMDQATMAQLAVIGSVKQRFEQFSHNLQASYSGAIANQAKAAQEAMANNVDACFDKYPQFDKEIVTIKEYLSSKGYSPEETEQLLKDTQFNPRTIGLLIDASTVYKANSAVNKSAPLAKRGRGINKTYVDRSKSAPAKLDYTGISSRDRASYEAFSSIFS